MPKPEPSGHGRISSSELIWRAMFLFLFAAVTFGLTFSQAFAAANCTITTVPDPAVIDEGQSVQFTGSVSGKPPATYDWNFNCSAPTECDTATSAAQQVEVTYLVAGTYSAVLNGTNDRNDSCTASVDVTVNAAGACTRNPPTFTMGNDQTIAPDGSAVYTLSLTNNDTAACADSTFNFAIASETGDTGSFLPSNLSDNSVTVAPGATDTSVSLTVTGNNTGADGDALTSTVSASDPADHAGQNQSDSVTTTITVGANTPVARGDAYATPVYNPDKGEPGLVVEASRVSGVLYNDFGGTPPLTAQLVSDVSSGNLLLNADGSFSYTPNASLADNDNDSFTYIAVDSLGLESDPATVNINILPDQPDYKIMMNYELGMHCTGFEFAYCCVLPPYNSILAQVVKPQATPSPDTGDDFPRLLEGSHQVGTDGLGRPTVVQAGALDGNGDYQTYMLEYFHDAQPRREGNMPDSFKAQSSTLISAVEGNSMFYQSTIYDSAEVLADGSLKTGSYEGADGVVLGDGSYATPCTTLPNGCTDNYANGWLNHFYIYADLEGSNPGNSSLEADKIRLGVAGHIEYPADSGAALHPMGPTGNGAFDNLLTFSGDTGTVVYTQMKVLENLPVMLTSPDIWEALGLPLTPFEDSIAFFAPGGPGSIDEDSVRPYVAMKAQLYEANCDQDPASGTYGECTKGSAVIGSNGQPVIGHGTAPIDIPNCERCHSVPPTDGQGNPNTNSPSYIRSDFGFPHNGDGTTVNSGDSLAAITDAEYQFWVAYYNILPVDSDWYARLKGAAINMLALHDFDQGTGFTANWPSGSINDPVAQNTRLGKESVICQKCHADNVIAVVKSATKSGNVIKPISEAIHWRHREINEYSLGDPTQEVGSIDFSDAAGRSGGCQGCHPAHRSDGVMDGYPITKGGDNFQANSDNRLASGGCFVGRDVHSNPLKDVDGVETPAHLNAVGNWLATNVFYNQDGEANESGHDTRGLWCTNCHTQLGQEMWKAEDCNDLIAGDCVNDVRGLGSLSQIASAIGANLNTVESWLDAKSNLDGHTTPDGIDHTHRIWDSSVGDALLATIEVSTTGPDACAPLTGVFNPTFGVDVCVSLDNDINPDPSVNILSFCTTQDCVDRINNNKTDQSQWRYPANPFQGTGTVAAAVPFDAATDGRDHWLAAGEPHCADCHAAPFVEQSGNINPYPPFNYPAKASLMRYSKGHQNISCQGCHESIHGLYPVTPAIDSTSYAQAAALNPDGSHGPIKCGACHEVGSDGIPTWMRGVTYNGNRIRTFDDAVSWAHTFTKQGSVLTGDGVCTNCHSYPKGKNGVISETDGNWLHHSYVGRVGRKVQDQAEIEALGHVAGDPDTDGDGVPDRTAQQIADTVCTACHSVQGGPSGAFLTLVTCDNTTWKSHVFDGRLSEKVWEFMTETETGSTCGW